MDYANAQQIHHEFAQWLINLRHYFHQHPELSNQEFNTTKKIKSLLSEHGVTIIDLPLKTGLVACINGDKPGPTIAIRSDIDALPIVETSEGDFCSSSHGVMHACGHDFHLTAALGCAILLNQQKSTLAGRVKIIFQPAEETGHGAPLIIETGVLDDVEVIFGLHNDPQLAVGVMGSRAGALTAAVDRFEINITSQGSHAARPHEGNDPAIMIAQLVNSLQSIISRNLPPGTNAVVSITQIHCGSTWNIIADKAYLEGTVRSFDPTIRALIIERMRQIIYGVQTSFAAQIEFIWHEGHPSVMNTERWVDFALDMGRRVGFDAKVINALTIGEDFSFYQEKIPGAFVMIGSGGPYALHHPKFRVDDTALFPTAYYLSVLAKQALEQLSLADK